MTWKPDRVLLRLRAERFDAATQKWDVHTRFEWLPKGKKATWRIISSRIRRLSLEYPLHDNDVRAVEPLLSFGVSAKYRTPGGNLRESFFLAYGDCAETAREYAIDLLREVRRATKIDRLELYPPPNPAAVGINFA